MRTLSPFLALNPLEFELIWIIIQCSAGKIYYDK